MVTEHLVVLQEVERYTHLRGQIFSQSFSDGNDLLRCNADILNRDFVNAIFSKVLKETLEGSNNSVAEDGKYFVRSKLDMCYTTLFIEGQVLEPLVNSFNKQGIT
jgi:hypothetical protein